MGYTTKFEGKLNFDRVLSILELRELEALVDFTSQTQQYSKYADTHPNSYNQWAPTYDGMGLEWDGGEKFYNYIEWLEWLITYYFAPRSITLNGVLQYQGEEISDVGYIEVVNNKVTDNKLTPKKGNVTQCPDCGKIFKP